MIKVNQEIFNLIQEKIIGLDFRKAKELYGGKLLIGLGEKFHSESTKKFYFEWEIFIRPPWRIVKGENLVCSSENESKDSSKIINEIDLGKLVSFETVNGKDIFLIFENGLKIDVMNLSIEYEALCAVYKREVEYELYYDKWVKFEPYHIRKFTEIEEVLSECSKDCNEIWSEIISANVTEYLCDDCFYYRPIDGYFHFLDYGICSNKASEYFGKLVGVHSGCLEHKTLKDILLV